MLFCFVLPCHFFPAGELTTSQLAIGENDLSMSLFCRCLSRSFSLLLLACAARSALLALSSLFSLLGSSLLVSLFCLALLKTLCDSSAASGEDSVD